MNGGPSSLSGHGGRLAAAQARFPNAPAPWLDLSTGINPRPYSVPPQAYEDWGRLPDPSDLARLEAAAAEAFGVDDPSRVVAMPGSETAIRLLPKILPRERVSLPLPTYSSHAHAWRRVGSELVDDPAQADICVVVNPNNPDGRSLPPEAVLTLGQRGAIVDEAFVECEPSLSVARFAGAPDHEQLVVLRSFGKFYGLAGLRLGFVIARPALARRLRDTLGEWPLSAPALAAGLAAYPDTAWADATRANLADDAARLDALLTGAGFEVLGGTSLFRLARTANAARRFESLARAGVLTRPFDHDASLLRFGLPGFDADWARLAAALEISR
ncbi:threonine-phosphate decarboxylase CobD [Caulobacter endophyticus]|uniref:threonine-phosphate decarboxylase CobD n=1 Tax=Caulobacter endophyticus TaxID=2172652 RepID=UPI00240E9F35|nr:threonine-phosphate decarboxylase CobD [Caulobacter endophyticus]MDG2531423.1 threonine-phosphate decarboxylase CobD [Caulobacter endophyticus]